MSRAAHAMQQHMWPQLRERIRVTVTEQRTELDEGQIVTAGTALISKHSLMHMISYDPSMAQEQMCRENAGAVEIHIRALRQGRYAVPSAHQTTRAAFMSQCVTVARWFSNSHQTSLPTGLAFMAAFISSCHRPPSQPQPNTSNP